MVGEEFARAGEDLDSGSGGDWYAEYSGLQQDFAGICLRHRPICSIFCTILQTT